MVTDHGNGQKAFKTNSSTNGVDTALRPMPCVHLSRNDIHFKALDHVCNYTTLRNRINSIVGID